ncbi:hypothetical protein ACFDTO_35355 [Microbacteriaceae bacterium 4G12]
MKKVVLGLIGLVAAFAFSFTAVNPTNVQQASGQLSEGDHH